MKKICTFLIVLWVGGGLFAQDLDWEKRRLLKDKLYDLLNDYQNVVGFQRVNQTNISQEQIAAFRRLFSPDAIIFDDINPVDTLITYEDVGPLQLPKYPYQLKEKSLDEFIQSLVKNYPTGLLVSINKVYIDYSELENRKAHILIEKEISGVTPQKFQFQNLDTLLFSVETNLEYDSVWISRIEGIGHDFSCIECDFDGDKVLNEDDLCVFEKGDPVFAGCPSDSITKPRKQLAVSIFLSGFINRIDLGDELSPSFTYDELIQRNSEIGEISNPLSSSLDLGFAVEIDYNLNETVSFSTGFQLIPFTSKLSLDTFHVQYKAVDESGTEYRSIITGSNIEEKYNLSYLGIPLLLKLKTKFSEQIHGFIHFGPIVSIPIKGNSKVDAAFDYEAIYHFVDGEFGFFSGRPRLADWLLTKEQIMLLNSDNEAETRAYFERHRDAGYNVGLNQSVGNSADYKPGATMLLLARLGVSINLSNNLDFLVHGSAMFGSTPGENNQNYQLTNSVGSYHSLTQSAEDLGFRSYGLSVGLQLRLPTKRLSEI